MIDKKIKSLYVATIGFFDGVHVGHQKLISLVSKTAELNNLKSLVLTFDTVAKIKNNLIYPLEEKIKILSSFNIDEIKVLNFNSIRNFTPEEFFKKFILESKISILIVGEDFRFGKDALGDIKKLKVLSKTYNICLFVISDVFAEINNIREAVSSSLIRENILKCNFKEVEALLGREYWLGGVVVAGKGLGKKVGIPTINFAPEKDLLIPHGVFLGISEIDNEKFYSVANFGFAPTVEKENINFICEIHIIDKVINKKVNYIKFRPIKKIRNEKKFSSVDEMRKQIIKDIEYSRRFFHHKF
jgi:riboflavin kinase/FMN adenylyltransferase